MNLNNSSSRGPLTAADLPQWRTDGVNIDAVHRRTGSRDWLARQPQCAGPCDQGRKLCPCPEACELTNDDDALGAARGVVVGVILALSFWAALAAFLLA